MSRSMYIKIKDGEHFYTRIYGKDNINIDLDKDDNVLGVKILHYQKIQIEGIAGTNPLTIETGNLEKST